MKRLYNRLNEDYFSSLGDEENLDDNELSKEFTDSLKDQGLNFELHNFAEEALEQAIKIDEENIDILLPKGKDKEYTVFDDDKSNEKSYDELLPIYACDEDTDDEEIIEFKTNIIKRFVEFDVRVSWILANIFIFYSRNKDMSNSKTLSTTSRLQKNQMLAIGINEFIEDNNLNNEFLQKMFDFFINRFIDFYKSCHLSGTNYCPSYIHVYKEDSIIPFLDHWKNVSSKIIKNFIFKTIITNANKISFTQGNFTFHDSDEVFGGYFTVLQDDYYELRDAVYMYNIIEFIEKLRNLAKEYDNSDVNESYFDNYENDKDLDSDDLSDEMKEDLKQQSIEFTFNALDEIFDTLVANINNKAKEYEEELKDIRHGVFYSNYYISTIREGKARYGLTENEIKERQKLYFTYILDTEHNISFMSYDSFANNKQSTMIVLNNVKNTINNVYKNVFTPQFTIKNSLEATFYSIEDLVEHELDTVKYRYLDMFNSSWEEMVESRKKFGSYFYNKVDKFKYESVPEDKRFYKDQVRTDVKNKEDHKQYQFIAYLCNQIQIALDEIRKLKEEVL